MQELRSSDFLPSWSAARIRAFFGFDLWKQVEYIDVGDGWWWFLSSKVREEGESCNCHWSLSFSNSEILLDSCSNCHKQKFLTTCRWWMLHKKAQKSKDSWRIEWKRWMCKIEIFERIGEFCDLIWKLWLASENCG